MSKLVWITLAVTIALVFFVPGILAIGIKIVPFNDQPGYSTDYKKGIFGGHHVMQEFTSQWDRLTGVGLSLGNPNLKNKKNVVLSIYKDSITSLPIRQSVLNGQNISDGAFVRFLFDPILNSKNQKYLITLSSPDADSDEIINTFFTTGIPHWIGPLVYDKETLPGATPLVVFYRPASRFEVVKNIYTSLLKRLVGIN